MFLLNPKSGSFAWKGANEVDRPAVALGKTALRLNVNTDSLLIAFVAVTAAAVVLQAIVLTAMFFTVRKTAKTVREEVENLRVAIMPVVNHTREFLINVGPRIDSVTTDLSELTRGLREQSTELQTAATEIIERVRNQTNRIDHMFTGVLDRVDKAGEMVAEAFVLPLRQVTAVASAIKAVLSVLVSKRSPEPREIHAAADKDMFV